MSACPECARLRAELADLREEVDAWRATDKREAEQIGEAAKVRDVAKALGLRTYGPARLALRMIERPGQLFTKRAVLRLVTTQANVDVDEISDKGADVAVCLLRKALRLKAIAPGHVETVRGLGYRLTPRGALELRAAVPELAAS